MLNDSLCYAIEIANLHWGEVFNVRLLYRIKPVYDSSYRVGALTGIDRVFYQNAYPVTAVVYRFYPIQEPDLENLVPMQVGHFSIA